MEFDTFRISSLDPSLQSAAAATSAASTSSSRAAAAKPTFTSIPHKLEPYLLLAKNARGASAIKLIGDVTAAEGVWVFGELLEVNGIKELAKSEEGRKWYDLLELFAYGDWKDYEVARASLPPLNEAQALKLKHLSLVSLAMASRSLPYQLVLSSLSLPSPLALESLITTSIYAGLLTARLDQLSQTIVVDWSEARDVLVLPSSAPTSAGARVGVKADASGGLKAGEPVVQAVAGTGKVKNASGDRMIVDGESSVKDGLEGFRKSAVTVNDLRTAISNWKQTIKRALDETDARIAEARNAEDVRRAELASHNHLLERALADYSKTLDARQGSGYASTLFGQGGPAMPGQSGPSLGGRGLSYDDALDPESFGGRGGGSIESRGGGAGPDGRAWLSPARDNSLGGGAGGAAGRAKKRQRP